MEFERRPVAEWIAELGSRISRHRLNQDLSQAELARRAGISLRTVARMEAGEAVQLESFLRLLSALGLEGALGSLIPEVPESPIRQLERGPAERQRASRRREEPEKSDWEWGEEE